MTNLETKTSDWKLLKEGLKRRAGLILITAVLGLGFSYCAYNEKQREDAYNQDLILRSYSMVESTEQSGEQK